MLSYIARRKRWWATLCELDPDIRRSEAMRANLFGRVVWTYPARSN